MGLFPQLILSLTLMALSGPVMAGWLTPIETDSKLTQPTAGHHPWIVKEFLNRWFSWDPQDLLPPLSSKCSKNRLQFELMKTTSNETWNELFKAYSKTCGAEAFQNYGPDWLGTLGMFAMEYPLGKSPLMRRMLITLPNGQKLKAVLSLKDQKKRPFVIVRMGITGNIEEAFAERFFYYHLFERGFSHFLMVENMTGSDFIHNNHSLDFGGLLEGYQNIWIAQKLKDPKEPLSRLIESLHLMGVSLGGHGVHVAAWLAPVQKNKKLYQSFLGLCPLVNLQTNYEYLFKASPLRFPLEIWARSRFQPVAEFRPDLLKWEPGLMLRLIQSSAQSFKKPSSEIFQLVEPEFLKTMTDFYELHQLSEWDLKSRASMQTWVTRDDLIVPAGLNAQTLPGDHPMIIQQGHHCTFPVHWHPHVTQALFNAHILKNSSVKLSEHKVVMGSQQHLDWSFFDVKVEKEKGIIVVLRSTKTRQYQQFLVPADSLDSIFDPNQGEIFQLKALRRWFSTNLTIRYDRDSQMTVTWPFVSP